MTRDDQWIQDTTFLTSDPVAAVHTFYIQSLSEENGWVLVATGADRKPTSLVNRAACPIYSLTITAHAETPQETRVDLRRKKELCTNF